MKKRYISPSLVVDGSPCRFCRKVFNCLLTPAQFADMISVVDDVIYCNKFIFQKIVL